MPEETELLSMEIILETILWKKNLMELVSVLKNKKDNSVLVSADINIIEHMI